MVKLVFVSREGNEKKKIKIIAVKVRKFRHNENVLKVFFSHIRITPYAIFYVRGAQREGGLRVDFSPSRHFLAGFSTAVLTRVV